jgi:hypothetical protein
MSDVGEETFEIELADWLSQKKNLPKRIHIKIIRETDKAVYVDQVTELGEVISTFWLPKSVVKYIN